MIKLEDLAVPFSNHLCDHLKNNDKQITSSNSEFLNTLRKFNNEEIDVGKKKKSDALPLKIFNLLSFHDKKKAEGFH